MRWWQNGDKHWVLDGGRRRGAVGSRCEEWKLGFIKNDMSGNVDSARWKVKTLESKMVFAVPDKNTRSGSKGKFGGIIGTQEWPTFTTKCL